MSRMVHCIKLNKEAEGLDFAPMPGELGKKCQRKPGLAGLNNKRC